MLVTVISTASPRSFLRVALFCAICCLLLIGSNPCLAVEEDVVTLRQRADFSEVHEVTVHPNAVADQSTPKSLVPDGIIIKLRAQSSQTVFRDLQHGGEVFASQPSAAAEPTRCRPA